MGHYLIQAAYSPEAWATLAKNPQDRSQAIVPVIEGLGGKLEAFYVAFGEYDIVAIASFPTNVDAAAFAIGTSSGGALKAIKTTPLMEPTDAVEAMRKAGGIGYEPPG